MFDQLKRWAKMMERDIFVLYLAGRDPRVPWYVKLLAAATAAYAFSPIDLVPDFIPVIGYLDDMIIVPGAIWLTLRLIPTEILAELRNEASHRLQQCPRSAFAACVIVAIWLGIALLAGWLCWRR